MRRSTPALASLLFVLVLAACGGGDDTPAGADGDATTPTADTTTTTTTTPTTAAGDATTTSSTTSTTTTSTPSTASVAPAATMPPETAPPETTTAPTTAPPTEPGASDDCLVGEWVVTEAEMNAFYDAVEARLDQPVDFTITGEAGLVFTDTAYAWAPAFTLQLDLSGITGTGDAGGSISGTYTTADGVLSTEVGESAMTLTVEVAGQTIDGAELGNGFITSVPFVDSPYSCDGPTPVIQFETIDDRHPVTLTPAG